MALTTTRALLRASVRQAADCESSSASQRHPDAELNDFINRGIGAFYDLINASRGGRYYVSSQSITTVSGTASYALAGSFEKLLSVVALVGSCLRPLVPVENELERVELSNPANGWTGQPWKYDLEGANIVIYPTPLGAYTLTVRYVPAPPQLTDDSTTFDTIGRWDDYIVFYAAREVATKDEEWELVASLSARLAEVEARIRASAPARDQGRPPIVQDVRGDGFRRYGRYRRWG